MSHRLSHQVQPSLPDCCLRKHRFPVTVPVSPSLTGPLSFQAIQQTLSSKCPSPIGSARCLTLNRNKRLPQMGIFFFSFFPPNGNLLNRIVNGLHERTLCSLKWQEASLSFSRNAAPSTKVFVLSTVQFSTNSLPGIMLDTKGGIQK